MNAISSLGFGESQQRDFDSVSSPGAVPARVAAVDRGALTVLGALVDPLAPLVVPHRGSTGIDAPVAGDWVVLSPAGNVYTIAQILPRRSLFVRKEAGRGSGAQPIAANVDRVLVVTAVGDDLSPARVERYLTAIYAGGSRPVIVINKADRPHDTESVLRSISSSAPGVDVVLASALSEGGLAPFLALVPPPMTVVLVGSSGVGKTTILNRLLAGEGVSRPHDREGSDTPACRPRATTEVRASDDTGRHTTTRRELTVTPSGLLVIDTPGVREIGLYDASSGLSAAFPDIEELAASCRFTDCAHGVEPGCAIREAIEQGTLPAARADRYEHLAREIALNDARAGARRSHDEKQRWKAIHKQARERQKLSRKLGFKGAPPDKP